MSLQPPSSIRALKAWLKNDGPSTIHPDESMLALARKVALEGMHERAAERGLAAPEDLSNACKFSSLLFKSLFGGRIEGNERHQYNRLHGEIFDLNECATDVVKMRQTFGDEATYRHDPIFFANPEHLESMLSCLPRVSRWAENFHAQTMEPPCAERLLGLDLVGELGGALEFHKLDIRNVHDKGEGWATYDFEINVAKPGSKRDRWRSASVSKAFGIDRPSVDMMSSGQIVGRIWTLGDEASAREQLAESLEKIIIEWRNGCNETLEKLNALKYKDASTPALR